MLYKTGVLLSRVVVGSSLPDTGYWLGFSNMQEGSGCRQLGYLG